MSRTILCLLIAATFVSAAARADTIIMKNGETLEGKELSRDNASLELEVKFGTVRVPLDKILRIEVETPEQAEAREAKEAEEKEYAAQMKEEGKVLYKGEWMEEKEKIAAEKKVAAAKKKKADERAAAKKKAEELAAKKKAEEEKRLAELQKQQQRLDDDWDARDARFAERHGGRNGRGGRNNNNYNNNYNNNNSRYNDYNPYRGSSVLGGNIDQMIQNYTRGGGRR